MWLKYDSYIIIPKRTVSDGAMELVDKISNEMRCAIAEIGVC